MTNSKRPPHYLELCEKFDFSPILLVVAFLLLLVFLLLLLLLLLPQSLGVGQLHWAPPLGWQEEAYWTGLAELKAAGRIREVGLSNYGPKGVERAHRFLAGLDTQLASNQVRLRYPKS